LLSIAGSAGAFESLRRLLAEVPSDWSAAIVVAVHTGPGSALVDVLAHQSRLPITWASCGMRLETRRVYVAPVGTHLIINPDAHLTVSEAPRIRLFRPSADWLFESAAASFGDRHVAIVLSGAMSDGAYKLRGIKRRGGAVLVQDPATCAHGDMPRAAIATGQVDAVLPIEAMLHAASQIFARHGARRDIAAWDDPFGTLSNN
jgi:two-component system, chemotaxis family, protein-glutamate methylesterase/glutaminase